MVLSNMDGKSRNRLSDARVTSTRQQSDCHGDVEGHFELVGFVAAGHTLEVDLDAEAPTEVIRGPRSGAR
jgi:hypothetical protein